MVMVSKNCEKLQVVSQKNKCCVDGNRKRGSPKIRRTAVRQPDSCLLLWKEQPKLWYRTWQAGGILCIPCALYSIKWTGFDRKVNKYTVFFTFTYILYLTFSFFPDVVYFEMHIVISCLTALHSKKVAWSLTALLLLVIFVSMGTQQELSVVNLIKTFTWELWCLFLLWLSCTEVYTNLSTFSRNL